MAENPDAGNGKPAAGAPGQSVQVRVLGQYIKDLSFENPNVDKLFDQPTRKAQLCASRSM